MIPTPRRLFATVSFVALSIPAVAGSLAPDLKEVLDSAAADDRVPIVVLMDEYPSREELLAGAGGLNRKDRRAHVISTLKNLASRSQQPVHDVLATDRDRIRDVRVLWGINGVALQATPEAIARLASLPQVRWVLHDREIPWQQAIDVDLERLLAEHPPRPGRSEGPFPQHDGNGDGPTGGDTSGPNPTATVAPELVAMGAPRVWDDLGYTGAGVVVAVIDSGVDRTHPDLADHIWSNLDEVDGNGIDDDGNGFVDDTWGWDFCGNDNDPSSGTHGTQAAGQVAGDGTNGTVTGMAPDAEIMALGINCGGPSSWWQASDYAMANGADVITQSFSYKWTEEPDYQAFRRQTDTELAVGLIHVNSTGNTGLDFDKPVPYNVSVPGNCPSPWLHPDQTIVGAVSSTIGTANIDWSTDDISPTSPYGPAAWEDIQANTDPSYPHTIEPLFQDYPYENGDQMGLLKPDLAAYGDGTTSICPGTGYCTFAGTSSATPHIAGVVALMLSANLEASPEFLTEAILTTAEPRGAPGKNNRFGTGLVQAYAAAQFVESGIIYDSHSIDDAEGGNGNLELDPGERVVMSVAVRNVDAVAVDGLEAILSSSSPGVTIHNRHATYPTVPASGTAASTAPHYSLTIDSSTCSSIVAFDLELRFNGENTRSTFYVRVGGAAQAGVLLSDDFESDLGWSTDAGSATQGAWVREDPIGVADGSGQASNPEDDTSTPGVACFVTGNGELNGKKDENNNDVDGGAVTLLSPPFGQPNILSLDLRYDRWYYDNSQGGDSFTTEVSGDGGQSWTTAEWIINGTNGWGTHTANLFALVTPTDDMRIRFVVEDGSEDSAVEGAVDQVEIHGQWVTCEDYTEPILQAPNPVGDTLGVAVDAAGHAVLTWEAPAVDAGHDVATLYRIERATSPGGPFAEAGSATATTWVDVDALAAAESFYYRVRGENSGGAE